MSKNLLLLAVAFVAIQSGVANAGPALNNISSTMLNTAYGRKFNTARTAESLNCQIYTTGSCPVISGHWRLLHGYSPDGYPCCEYFPFNAMTETEFQEMQSEATDAELLQQAMSPSLTESHWGFISTTNRSPNNGRTVAAEAKLDACLGHGSVDYIKGLATFQQLNTCRGSSQCGDSIKNQYCTSTTPNGESVCQDRCDCVFNGTCNSY